MSKEHEIMEEIFGTAKQWNGYKLSWCDLCDTAVITCPKCRNSSCNGGGCDSCSSAFDEFSKSKTQVHSYLSEPEKVVYQKSKQLQKFILLSLCAGDVEINWKTLQDEGQLSGRDEELFAKELEPNND